MVPAMKTAPAFMVYASDTIADKRYRLMSLEERGLLLSLLCECWVNRSVPTNAGDLAQWLGYPVAAINAALTERVLSFFDEDQGELKAPELERYRGELEARRIKMSEGGRMGALRKAGKRDVRPRHPEGYPQGSRVETGRDETSRGESLGKDDSPIDDPWVKAYDDAQYGPI